MSITDIGTINSAEIARTPATLVGGTAPASNAYSPNINRIRTMNIDPGYVLESNKPALPRLEPPYREINVLVTEVGSPVSRTVRLYRNSDGLLMQTKRTGANGRTTFEWIDDSINYFLVAFDDDGAPVRNAVIYDRIQSLSAPNKFTNTGNFTDYTYTVSNLGTTIARSSGNYFDATEVSIVNFNRTLVDLTGKTWFGGAIQFDASPRFGTGALQFNGTSTVVSCAPSNDFNFGTGDFCIQFWIKTSFDYSTLGGLARIIAPDKSVNPTGGLQICVGNGSFGTTANRISLQGPSVAIINTTSAINDGLWHHIAISRQSGTVRIFFDGQQQGSTTDTTNYTVLATDGLRMGCRSDRNNTTFFTGSIDSLEITNGLPIYTANFTIPASEFTRSIGSTAVGFSRTEDTVNRSTQKHNYQFSLSSDAVARVGFTKGYVDSALQLLGTGANSWAVTASNTGTGIMVSANTTIASTPTVPQVSLTALEYIATAYSQSSNYSAGLAANTTNMRDGDFSTGAATGNSNGEFIAMDLGVSKAVSTIRVGSAINLAGWGAVSPYLEGRRIQYSQDGTNWTTATLVSGVTSSNAAFDIQLPFTITARYWRIIAPEQSAGNNWVALTEFRAYGIQDRAVNLLVDWNNGRVWVAVNGVYTNVAANPDAGTGFDFVIPFDVPVYMAASTAAVGSTVTLRDQASTWSLPNATQFTGSSQRL